MSVAMSSNILKDQIAASGIGAFNEWKQQTHASQLDQVVKDALAAEKQQNANLEKALGHMMKMRQFLSDPERILGSQQTKHGEVAEHLEVNVRNAWSAIKGNGEVATFEGVGRTAPEDFILNGVKYQSKFINGTNNTLKHVLNHFETYQDDSMNYSIPKDQYHVIEAVRAGVRPADLSDKSVRAILRKVEEIEVETSRSFDDIVRPSVSNYDEVQLGRVGGTVSGYQDELVDENQRIKEEIRSEAREKAKAIEGKRGPSVKEGAKAAGAAATIAASLSVITTIYRKVKDGRLIQDFDKEDWKEVGMEGVKAGAKGGVTAGTIYALTNLTSLSAPFAGAIASGMIGLSSLMADVSKDRITMDEFVTQGQILCIEAGIAATGGAIGQMLIPIPVLGSIIGTVTANFIWSFAKGRLGAKEQELKAKLDAYIASILAQIDQAYLDIIARIDATYQRFDSLIEAAFDVDANAAVLAAASVDLAVELGVDKSKILREDVDLEAFFLG